MGFGVFIHRSDSIYDDSPAEQYQFPSQYLRRVEACVGDWIIYYEPRKIAETRGYFAIAKVSQIISDSGASGMYLALIEPGSYLDFANPVPFNGATGPVERGVLGSTTTCHRPALTRSRRLLDLTSSATVLASPYRGFYAIESSVALSFAPMMSAAL